MVKLVSNCFDSITTTPQTWVHEREHYAACLTTDYSAAPRFD